MQFCTKISQTLPDPQSISFPSHIIFPLSKHIKEYKVFILMISHNKQKKITSFLESKMVLHLLMLMKTLIDERHEPC